MTRHILISAAAVVGLAVCGCKDNNNDGMTWFEDDNEPELASGRIEASASLEDHLAGWPEPSRKAAMQMRQKYGEPHGMTPDHITWRNNGPWEETIIRKDPIDHDFPMPHKDVLEQVIAYEVPTDKFDELAAYDGSVIVERTRGTMAARCDKEGANFLALNLAHDIVTGSKTVDEARQYYADAIRRFMQEGQKDPYMQELKFDPPRRAGDADKTVLDMGASSGA